MGVEVAVEVVEVIVEEVEEMGDGTTERGEESDVGVELTTREDDFG